MPQQKEQTVEQIHDSKVIGVATVRVAVAETLEQARSAAETVKVVYAKTPHNTNDRLFETPSDSKPKDSPKTGNTASGLNPAKEVTKRGNTATALSAAAIKHDGIY